MNNGNASNHENNELIAIVRTFRIVNSTPVHFAFNAAIVVLCIAKNNALQYRRYDWVVKKKKVCIIENECKIGKSKMKTMTGTEKSEFMQACSVIHVF